MTPSRFGMFAKDTLRASIDYGRGNLGETRGKSCGGSSSQFPIRDGPLLRNKGNKESTALVCQLIHSTSALLRTQLRPFGRIRYDVVAMFFFRLQNITPGVQRGYHGAPAMWHDRGKLCIRGLGQVFASILGGTSDADIGELTIGKKRWVVPQA